MSDVPNTDPRRSNLWGVAREDLLELPQVSGSRVTSQWGMGLLILTEAVFFSCLLAAYFFLRSNAPVWPPNDVALPDLTLSSIGTVFLVSSSAVLIWADERLRHDHMGQAKALLALTILLGAVFLGLQVYEFTQLDFSPTDGTYGSMFYTITSLHAAHVSVGLLSLLVILLWAQLGYFRPHRHLSFSNVSLYWHFVDGVWIFVWTSLYWSPHFLGTTSLEAGVRHLNLFGIGG